MFVDATRYDSSDGNIDTNNPAGEIKLADVFGVYPENGTLTSSTFDTGSESNFHHLYWEPTDQPPLSGPGSVRFQIASSASSSPTSWTFRGPDGTTSTFYETPGTAIASVHDDDRYVRYRIFLHTDDTSVTPNVAGVSFTFTSDCVPAGQVLFQGKSTGDYTLEVEKDGYASVQIPVTISSGWQQQTVTLSPN